MKKRNRNILIVCTILVILIPICLLAYPYIAAFYFSLHSQKLANQSTEHYLYTRSVVTNTPDGGTTTGSISCEVWYHDDSHYVIERSSSKGNREYLKYNEQKYTRPLDTNANWEPALHMPGGNIWDSATQILRSEYPTQIRKSNGCTEVVIRKEFTGSPDNPTGSLEVFETIIRFNRKHEPESFQMVSTTYNKLQEDPADIHSIMTVTYADFTYGQEIIDLVNAQCATVK